MIVDCHCHAGPGDGFTGPWDTRASVGRYLLRARRAGIQRTVLFGAFHSDYRVANNAVSALVARYPHRFFGFVFVHPERDHGKIRSIVGKLVGDDGFCGIKVHGRDGRLTREICEAAREFRVPVLYDVVGQVATVELFAPEYPMVDFIIPHLGSFGDDWAAQLAMVDLITRHRNVYTDTAGVRRFDLLEQAVRRAGPEKILFGTDGPWLHPGVEMAKVRALGLDHRSEALVLGGNFLRLTARARLDRSLPIAYPAPFEMPAQRGRKF